MQDTKTKLEREEQEKKEKEAREAQEKEIMYEKCKNQADIEKKLRLEEEYNSRPFQRLRPSEKDNKSPENSDDFGF